MLPSSVNEEMFTSAQEALKKKSRECICFIALCSSLLYGRMNQPYVYLYLLFCGLASRRGHHRALSSFCCAPRKVLTRCLLYT